MSSDGEPIPNLAPADFRLEDNGKPSRIFTVRPPAASDAFQIVLILDSLNPGAQHVTDRAAAFLRRNGGQLPYPVSVYILNSMGLFPAGGPSRDGNALAAMIAHPERHSIRGPVPLDWKGTPINEFNNFPTQREVLSQSALGAMILRLRNEPGRKLVVWMGAGWEPTLTADEFLFNRITEFSTRMREAGIVLDWVNDEQLDWEKRFRLNEFIQPALTKKDAAAGRLTLPVLALQSGGLVLTAHDVESSLAQCIREAAASYTLTFDPEKTGQVDEFHALQVQVAKAGAMVRAAAGYYDEPSYYDHPNTGLKHISVADLDVLVREEASRQESALLEELPRLQLTERLSTPHLQQLLALLHNDRGRQELIGLSDASAFLHLPAAEIPNEPPPSTDEQRAMMERTFAYLKNVIPKLPNFFAIRTTVFYEPKPFKGQETWKTFVGDPDLYPAGVSKATVLYRDGKQLVTDETTRKNRAFARKTGSLETSGEFGSALSVLVYGFAGKGSSVFWDHWENGPEGLEAVFRFHVPESASRFSTTYCCTPQDGGHGIFKKFVAYRGEVAIDPKSGAILRIAEESELDLEQNPDLPVSRSALGIEYASVNIGGNRYICPVRSFSILRGRQLNEIPEWGSNLFLSGAFEEMINDMSYSGYHKFGSESRILTGADPVLVPPKQ